MSDRPHQSEPVASDDSTSAEWRTCYYRGLAGTVQISLFPFVFGVLFVTAAISRGFTGGETMLMSASVFAGSVLFACMELWSEPLAYVAIAVTTASVGCRHMLMGLTLPPLFSKHVRRAPLASLFFLTDLNWLLTTKAADVSNRFAYFLGSSTLVYGAWMSGSLVGLLAAGVVDETTINATRSTGPIFLSLVIIMYSKGFRGSRVPWLIAGIAAGLASLYSVKIAVLTGVAVGTIAAVIATGQRHA